MSTNRIKEEEEFEAMYQAYAAEMYRRAGRAGPPRPTPARVQFQRQQDVPTRLRDSGPVLPRGANDAVTGGAMRMEREGAPSNTVTGAANPLPSSGSGDRRPRVDEDNASNTRAAVSESVKTDMNRPDVLAGTVGAPPLPSGNEVGGGENKNDEPNRVVPGDVNSNRSGVVGGGDAVPEVTRLRPGGGIMRPGESASLHRFGDEEEMLERYRAFRSGVGAGPGTIVRFSFEIRCEDQRPGPEEVGAREAFRPGQNVTNLPAQNGYTGVGGASRTAFHGAGQGIGNGGGVYGGGPSQTRSHASHAARGGHAGGNWGRGGQNHHQGSFGIGGQRSGQVGGGQRGGGGYQGGGRGFGGPNNHQERGFAGGNRVGGHRFDNRQQRNQRKWAKREERQR